MNIYQSIFTNKPPPEKFAELPFAVLSFVISYVRQIDFSPLYFSLLYAFAEIHVRSCAFRCFFFAETHFAEMPFAEGIPYRDTVARCFKKHPIV